MVVFAASSPFYCVAVVAAVVNVVVALGATTTPLFSEHHHHPFETDTAGCTVCIKGAGAGVAFIVVVGNRFIM